MWTTEGWNYGSWRNKLEQQTFKSKGRRRKGHAALIKDMKHAYNILVVKPEGKLSLGRFRQCTG
jgi:hypothetical protein